MRHAKAEPFASSDHARPLTERGLRDARAAGVHLHDRGLVPDRALVSSATRALETWSALAEAFPGADIEVVVDDALFAANADTVLEALRTVPEDTGTVLFLGHNPTAAYLCHLLDDGEGDAEAVLGMLQGFPPAALVAFEVSTPWSGLEAEGGRVVDFHVGQG
jgi:phosphohistidine phosphatase